MQSPKSSQKRNKTHRSQMLFHHSAANPESCIKKTLLSPNSGRHTKLCRNVARVHRKHGSVYFHGKPAAASQQQQAGSNKPAAAAAGGSSSTSSSNRNLLRNLLQNPVEPDLVLHQSLPAFSRTFGTFSEISLNLTRRPHQCTPELFWAEDPISLRCWGKKCN